AKKSVVDSIKEKAAVWFMAQTDKAEVKSVVATSELVEAQFDGKYLYPPINILDGDFNSTWCEADQNGSGIGESITVEFSEPVSFDEIQLVNGFASKDYYKKNNRVKSIVLTQVAKRHFQQKEYTLLDDKPTWQSINFALPQTAQTITIKITDVYRGSKYDDTCLCDIRLLYKGKVIPFSGVAELKKVQEENSKLMLKSNKADFETQFFALFYGGTRMYLKSQIDDSAIVITRNGSSYIENVEEAAGKYIKNGSKAEIIRQIKNTGYAYNEYRSGEKDDFYLTVENDDYTNWFNNRIAEKSDEEYILIGWEGYGWRRRWSLGNFRIIETDTVDYVETTTATIIKIEGNTIYWNGVPYTVLTEKQVYDCRFYDGP
ncbi:MAG: nicotine adenine dinucleotide glycohydrolase, partial [Treponema sp.]|uniref:NADase-type glycan-binding domain-containing protein n=1 Tax=Treponema sp. TaxID=166 RepID=UPI0025F226DF